MKICIDLSSLYDNFSGIERYALSITKELICEKENEYVLIFRNNVHKDFIEVPENVTTVVVIGNKKLLYYQITLLKALNKISADVYLFLAFPAPFFWNKKNTINTIHDLSCWDCKNSNKRHMIWYFKVMYWKASRRNKHIITVSNFSKSRIKDILKVKENNIHVVYNGIGNQFYSNDVNTNEIVKNKYGLPTNYILCVATIEPRKNLRILTEVLSELNEEGKSYELVLAGRKGWMTETLLEGTNKNYIEHIHFTGFVDEEDLPAVYNAAQLFVFPSLYEGFGIPPLEAMACETMVLSSDASSLPEVLGDAALYFESKNKASLREKIIEAMNMNESEYARYVSRGVLQARKYNWKQNAQCMLDVFNGI